MLGTVLNCYKMMEQLSLSMGLRVERNTALEQSIKSSLLDTDDKLTKAETQLQEYKNQEQNTHNDQRLNQRSR